jgi:uncharacterized protein (DUF58 family)
MRTYEHIWEGTDPYLTEECVKVAASLATRFNEHDLPFSLHTNGFVVGDFDNEVEVGRGARHLARALEALARINAFTRVELSVLMGRFRWTLDPRLTVLLVTPRLDPAVVDSLRELNRHGIQTRTLLVRESPPSSRDDAAVDGAADARQPVFEVVMVGPAGEER